MYSVNIMILNLVVIKVRTPISLQKIKKEKKILPIMLSPLFFRRVCVISSKPEVGTQASEFWS